MTARDFVDKLQETLEGQRNPKKAAPMAAYMKDKFLFLGLPQTELNPFVKPLLKEVKSLVTTKFLHDSVALLWRLPEREYQYVALSFLYKHTPQASIKTLAVIEKCVTQKSWWDTVDSLASLVGKLVWQFPEWIERLEVYSTHDNVWLRRIALLYQLNHRDKTDQKRLFRYCLINASEEEFFIRKAIGWALREYSKSNPEAVRSFLAKHEGKFSSLSVREASKYL
ncbi:MAG: DNA alkylation repair protein [Trueperaceae bacterium]